MDRQEKIIKKKKRSVERAIKNGNRNKDRIRASSSDCPFDVEINNSYGTCHCGGTKFTDCVEDI